MIRSNPSVSIVIIIYYLCDLEKKTPLIFAIFKKKDNKRMLYDYPVNNYINI